MGMVITLMSRNTIESISADVQINHVLRFHGHNTRTHDSDKTDIIKSLADALILPK